MAWTQRFQDRFSEQVLDLLQQHLAPLEGLGAETIAQLASFVLEGESEDALELVRAERFAGNDLGLSTDTHPGLASHTKRACRADLVRALGLLHASEQLSPSKNSTEILCRLGRVWFAATRDPDEEIESPEPDSTPSWLETLHEEMRHVRYLGEGSDRLFALIDAAELAGILERRDENTDAAIWMGLGLCTQPPHHLDMDVPASQMTGLAELIGERPRGVESYFRLETRPTERLRGALTVCQLLGAEGWRLLEETAGITRATLSQLTFNVPYQVAGRKQLRPVARELVLSHGEHAAATLRNGTPEERFECLKTLMVLLPRDLLAWLDDNEVPGDLVVRTMMDTLQDGYSQQSYELKSWQVQQELLARHSDVVSSALLAGDVQTRLAILEFLAQRGYPPEASMRTLAECATSSAKTVRQAALSILSSHPQAALEALLERLATGTAQARHAAVRAIDVLKIEPPVDRLRAHLEGEKARRVRQAIEKILSDAPLEVKRALDEQAEDRIAKALPPPRDSGIDAEVPPDLADRLSGVYQLAYDKQLADWQQQEKPPEPSWRRVEKPVEMPPGWPSDVVDVVRSWNSEHGVESLVELRSKWPFRWTKPLKKIALAEDLSLAQIIRLWLLFDAFDLRDQSVVSVGYRGQETFNDWLQRPGNTLRDLSVALRALGLDDDLLAAHYLIEANNIYSYWRVPPKQAWPFVADHVDVVREYLDTHGRGKRNRFTRYGESDWLTVCLEVLAHFPALPRDIEDALWPVALGTGKMHRAAAQDCLTRHGYDIGPRTIAALGDGKKDIRLAGAQWLSRVSQPEAAPALRKALEKEKQEDVRATMLTALEAAGASIDDYFGPVRLLREAEKKLSKGLPKALSVLALDRLPDVRWRSGKRVAPLILHWELAKALKIKRVTPSPLQLRLGTALDEADREKLGQWVLEAWLAHDQALMSHAEALEAAEAEATQYARWYKEHTVEEWTEKLLSENLGKPRGSATKEKGLLSLASAFGGAGVAAPIHRYLEKWYGQRTPQCKALLEVLSHVDHPQATQVLVSISTRFRTAGIRKEALRLVEELADRKGWTRDQLADRTIPTAGLEKDGSLLLDTGKRRFTLRLDEELKLELRNPAGKVVKAISGPNKGEDEALFKAAKKQLSATRKELKAICALQRSRLYEAMCVQRTWSFAEWDEYLNRHPIMSRFCQRLVWVAEDHDSNRLAIFRPMEDHSLTDAEDEELSLADDARLRLAHASVEPEDVARSWREHLTDYQVEPLFAQFGDSYSLPEAKQVRDEVRDFEGWLIDSRKLHSLAGKLGWIRAQAEDNGYYDAYFKHFPTLGQKAVLGFSGLAMGEPGRDVALVKLQFVPTGQQPDTDSTFYGPAMRLDAVPPVLLSECYRDLRRISEAGGGHDPEWKRNVEYWGD